MKTLITSVTLQVNENFNQFTVFTTQNFKGQIYDGFTPYKSLLEATEQAEKMTKIWDVNCMAITKGYELINFKLNGTKEVKFVQTKN
jgi:hypothetical protein